MTDHNILLTALIMTALSTVILSLLLRVILRSHAKSIRITAAVLFVIALISVPGLFDVVLLSLNRTSGLNRLMIDPSWVVRVFPVVVALLLATIFNRRIPHAVR